MLASTLERISDPSARRAAQVAIGALLALLAVLSNLQSRMYSDPKTLYRTTIAQNPDDWMAHNNLGTIYLRGALHRADHDWPRRLDEFVEGCSGLFGMVDMANRLGVTRQRS